MSQRLLELFPPHRTYVEPFGGGAAVLFEKKPSPVEVYNDIDGGVVNFFRVLRDPAAFEEFRRLAELTPYAREEYEDLRARRGEGTPAERAHRFFVASRMGFAGRLDCGFGTAIQASAGRLSPAVQRYLSAVERLDEAVQRLRAVQVEHQDFRTILERYDTPHTLFYLDPPYAPESRSGGGYEHELTSEDHGDLVRVLLGIKGMAVLSGYACDAYRPLEDAGWETHAWEVTCHSVGKTSKASQFKGAGGLASQPRVERAWVSPSAVAARNLGQSDMFAMFADGAGDFEDGEAE